MTEDVKIALAEAAARIKALGPPDLTEKPRTWRALSPEEVAFIRSSPLGTKALGRLLGRGADVVRRCRNGKTHQEEAGTPERTTP